MRTADINNPELHVYAKDMSPPRLSFWRRLLRWILP
jgi:hypothetical protein